MGRSEGFVPVTKIVKHGVTVEQFYDAIGIGKREFLASDGVGHAVQFLNDFLHRSQQT